MLKVFSNDYDWYIAENREQAIELWEEWTGEDRNDYDDSNGWWCAPVSRLRGGNLGEVQCSNYAGPRLSVLCCCWQLAAHSFPPLRRRPPCRRRPRPATQRLSPWRRNNRVNAAAFGTSWVSARSLAVYVRSEPRSVLDWACDSRDSNRGHRC